MSDAYQNVLIRLKNLADAAYETYINRERMDECLGWEAKIDMGKFGAAELAAHRKAAESLGRHRAFNAAADILANAREVLARENRHE